MTASAPPTAEHPATRPRVEGVREFEILEAALQVLAEVGYDRVTMDAVAHRAKASKATLYRRWNDKATLVVDALRICQTSSLHTAVDTGSLRGDLLAAFCGAGGLTDKPEVDTFGSLLTTLHTDPEFATVFRREVLAPKIAAVRAIFQRSADRGEIGAHIDLDLLGPALAAIVLHRFFVLGEVPTADLVARVVDQIILPAATASGEAR